MSIDFATLQGLTIPEGVVTQIADASGNVLWALQNNKPIVLEVAKITSDTYAAETTYTGEQFILLNIYPKTNGTVSVTYGGLTKTITDTSGATSPNSQQVFFGTFNGVSDSVTTPASGTLTIEGEYENFAVGTFSTYANNKSKTNYCTCITAVTEWGNVKKIASAAFYNCTDLTSITIPPSVTYIGTNAFLGCSGLTSVHIADMDAWCRINFSGMQANPVYLAKNLYLNNTLVTNVTIPSDVTEIGNNAFCGCTSLESVSFHEGLTSIGEYAFYDCNKITFSSLPSSLTKIGYDAFYFKNIPDAYGTGIAMLCGEITIPSNVTSIGMHAFCFDIKNADAYFRMYLATVKVLATTPPTTQSYAFGNINYVAALREQGKTFKIIVPKGCGSAYSTAEGWSDYVGYIVEES